MRKANFLAPPLDYIELVQVNDLNHGTLAKVDALLKELEVVMRSGNDVLKYKSYKDIGALD